MTQFQSNQSQPVMVDGVRMPRGIVLGRYCSSCTLFSILKNKLIDYADDSTLLSVVPSPAVRDTLAKSLNRDH